MTLSFFTSADFTFTAVGDIMLCRGVGNRIKVYGVEYPFEPTAEILEYSNLTFANLECQLSKLGKPMPKKEYTFRAFPDTVKGLAYAGIDVVSLSNNHSMDYGKEALAETIEILEKNKIAAVGAGMNDTEAYRPTNFTINDIKVSVFAYSWNFYLTIKADKDQAGVSVIQKKRIGSDIKKAKKWADVIIVSFHWGWEYFSKPTEKDRELAHFVIDQGADLVVGHHPHIIQGIEVYKSGLICYSLGNFIFDQHDPCTQKGMILKCRFDSKGLLDAVSIPVSIDPREYRPKVASVESAREVFQCLEKLSRELGTELNLFIDDKKSFSTPKIRLYKRTVSN